MKIAVVHRYQNNRTHILCPCCRCKNLVALDPFSGSLMAYLLRNGFMPEYTRRVKHGEEEEEVNVIDEAINREQ
jgi:hypothetical protein